MPRKPGVSKVRATASRSNSAGAADPPEIRMASQRTSSKLEHQFASVKHLFELGSAQSRLAGYG
jgi:hypothetical protein